MTDIILKMKICASTLKKETNISSETLLNLYQTTFATSLRVSVLLVLMFRHVREVVLVRIESDTVVIVFRSIFSLLRKIIRMEKAKTLPRAARASHLLMSAAVFNDYTAGRTR